MTPAAGAILLIVRGSRLVLGTLIGIAVLGGGAWAVANLLTGELAPTEPISLARPFPGEARPDHLPDGTPVWVIGHGDGSADVLLGFDPHTPLGLGKMLWWCERAAALDNPHHGSKWDEYGIRIGGPAPTGLRSYDLRVEGDRLILGPLRNAPPTTVRHSGPPEHERQWCTGDDAPVRYHRFEGWRLWDSPADAVAARPEGWILLEGELVADRGDGRVHLCAPTGCQDRAPAANVGLAPADMEFGPLGAGRFIAQVDDGQLVGVSRVIVLEDRDR